MKYVSCLFFLLTGSLTLLAQVTMKTTLPASIPPNKEIRVDVTLHKGTVVNFAKYQIDVPAGVTLRELDSKTGSFSFENNRGKIIWVSIPPEDEFVLSFKLNSAAVAESGSFLQKFYYLENGTKKEVEADPVNVSFNALAGSSVSTAVIVSLAKDSSPVTSSSEAPEQPVAGIAKKEQPANTNPTPATEKKEVAASKIAEVKIRTETAAKPANSQGLVYKIQIGAYGENPGKTKYRALNDVVIIQEGTFFKVLTGTYKDKEEAIKRKEELLSQGFRGFVVSYENGRRIP